MKKGVCILVEYGVRYEVFLRDGFFIKKNLETGEEVFIDETEYNLYSIASKVNDSIVDKKGQTKKSILRRKDTSKKSKTDILGCEEEKIVKAVRARASKYEVSDDEKVLRELEEIINKSLASKQESVESSLKEETIYQAEDDYHFIGNSQEDESEELKFISLDDEITTTTEDEITTKGLVTFNTKFTPLDYGYRKRGLFHKIFKSRKSKAKIKKEKKVKRVKKEKVCKPKMHKVKSSRSMKKGIKFNVNKKAVAVTIAVVGLSIIMSFGKNYYDNHFSNEIHIEQDQDAMNVFWNTVNANTTINSAVKEELAIYFGKLYSYDLSNRTYELIMNNVKDMDFSKLDTLDIKDIERLLKGNKNASLIASELFNFKNNTVSENPKMCLLSNILSFNESAVINILEGKDLNAILAAGFGIYDNINLDNPEVITGDGKETFDCSEQIKEAIFGNITSDCELSSNMFSPYVRIYENRTECYLYFSKEKDSYKDVSKQVYREMLNNYFASREGNLDYSNVRDRELLYFYANALNDSNNFGTDDIVDFIINGTNSQLATYDMFDLMKYMSSNSIDHSKAVYLYGLISYGEDAIPLLQEINMCLKKDVEDGLITEIAYKSFLEQLSIGISIYVPSMEDEFNRANSENRSMDGYELKLFPTSKL